MLDDGTPPPDPVTIERVCNGSPRAQAYTDRKGRFSFRLGEASLISQDASQDDARYPGAQRSSIGSPRGQRGVLENCDLRASLAGYTSDVITLGSRRAMDDPDVGTIILHRLANVEGTAISMTSLAAPKEAQKAYQQGTQAFRKNRLDEAAKEFRRAVDIYPKYAAAWYWQGRVEEQTQDIQAARKSYDSAIAADAKFLSPYLRLAELRANDRDWTALAELTDRLIRLDSADYPVAYLYNAMAHLQLGHFDWAERSAQYGQKVDTLHRYPKLEEVLGLVLASKKEYLAAIQHLRSYLEAAPQGDDVAQTKQQLAELQRLAEADTRDQAAPRN
jgi:tetratricopeptide (TPR) repeat protein